MLKLKAMSEQDFEKFIAWARDDYAREQVKAGAWPEDRAEELAAQTFANQLPDGLATPNQWLYILEREEDGQARRTRYPISPIWRTG